MDVSAEAPKAPRKRRWKRIVILTLSGLLLYLAAESLLPAARQPSARVCVGLIHGYQAIGSPVARALGVRCRYDPSCSRYAEDAINHYGTLPGIVRTIGRLWRCSPWGGGGYDPVL